MTVSPLKTQILLVPGMEKGRLLLKERPSMLNNCVRYTLPAGLPPIFPVGQIYLFENPLLKKSPIIRLQATLTSCDELAPSV
ncbi:MAG: hypothetical protein ACRDEA_06890 [Microcystaceae cyanobacterium]